ncbi:MAG: putative glycoside hydrolase [Treponema sp.]|jgi:hypothetical protein|nr:putative glycoside hydrolase [Treponema sp.]
MAFSRVLRPLFLFFCLGSLYPQEDGGFPLLIGTGDGLYGLDLWGDLSLLWQGGEVRQIAAAGNSWALLSGAGVFWSDDLFHWENRSAGLPVKTIKLYQDGEKSFLPMVQELKDLMIHPGNPNVMVSATKDTVYLSRNAGRSWAGLGMPPYRTNGIKAVAAAFLPELTVFLSHSVYGIHYIQPDKPGAKWTELNTGIEKLETTDNADEIADIAVVQSAGAPALIYISQSFRRRIYTLDWGRKQFKLLWADPAGGLGTIDSLSPVMPEEDSPAPGLRGLRFVAEGMVAELSHREGPGAYFNRTDILEIVREIPSYLGLEPLCLVIRSPRQGPDGKASTENLINLHELWLLFEDRAIRPQAEQAQGREGLYLPVNRAMESGTLKPYLDILAERNLNMVVIDMKDDYGRLRFEPRNPDIARRGRVFRPLDIDAFLGEMKGRGIYTAARIVVFKDPVLADREGGKYAVWDSAAGKAWAGYYDTRRRKTTAQEQAEEKKNSPDIEILPAQDPDYEILRSYYDERWVDPYSEEVWDYIADIAVELHSRGFDEIQFDYIRFPTDGANLENARYRWQERGMDMESAIVSFLRHIRSRLDAPLSIDIYGANGWYRTGARTGQEVELLSRYVDVICPMYYPSHFEQDFLAQSPAELRPYRIYYQGAQRTARIGRGRIIVRPYVQAFYLNVSYDRRYYGPDYVRRQVEGVRDAGRGGLTYWNNSGRYDDIPLPGDFKETLSRP